MAEDKKDNKKRQTKAGMLETNSSQDASEKDKLSQEKDPENTPKISKEKAEGHKDGRPIH